MTNPKQKRVSCATCQRPLKTCICHLITQVAPCLEIAILQHPSEVSQSKGTAWLAHQCLIGSQLFIGERLENLPGLENWLAQGSVFLLYPVAPNDFVESFDAHRLLVNCGGTNQAKPKVLVLDGTWRKTYRILQSNPSLQVLPRVLLTAELKGRYRIRKSSKSASLSTLEAIYALLMEVDPDGDYQVLINSFDGLMDLLESFTLK
ncbi:DTW domain-containing protein [Thiomicrospira microaerophila]|uniref:tRNA-uridine aminocarboxypropyltransferase n=1 Tax=Thiomicrospira microaerophila TaxID=406020 RepID=UPI0024B1A57C|nr:tRNA-uridine aminocarboxypropyltransferase [Thiomicrospira microaerophila]UQB42772.1 DTW domain-containing protein [Thiomicrospira microaerophila]